MGGGPAGARLLQQRRPGRHGRRGVRCAGAPGRRPPLLRGRGDYAPLSGHHARRPAVRPAHGAPGRRRPLPWSIDVCVCLCGFDWRRGLGGRCSAPHALCAALLRTTARTHAPSRTMSPAPVQPCAACRAPARIVRGAATPALDHTIKEARGMRVRACRRAALPWRWRRPGTRRRRPRQQRWRRRRGQQSTGARRPPPRRRPPQRRRAGARPCRTLRAWLPCGGSWRWPGRCGRRAAPAGRRAGHPGELRGAAAGRA
jgi:hypothetical protein